MSGKDDWDVRQGMPRGEDIEDLLRRAAPRPRTEFVRELEARLVPHPAARRSGRLRVALGAVGMIAALAAIMLMLAIGGLLPLGLRNAGPVEATPRCRTVVEVRRERRQVIRVDAAGEFQVTTRAVPVRRSVRRCR
jgi:hypothetical protein